jgi:transcriptional regulator with XRE-family HTH domain
VARTPAQRGPFGRWLKQVREDRYDTQAQAIAELRRLAGVAISPSEFAQWESGSRVPRDDNPKVARLYEFFGSRPTEALEPTQSGDQVAAALLIQAAALDRHTEAITALVSRLESLASDAIREGIADALREAGLGQGGEALPPEQPPGPFGESPRQ